jgi:hypothetical protein
MQNNKKSNKPTSEILDLKVSDDFVTIEFFYEGDYYGPVNIYLNDVEKCAKINEWLIDYCPEGETIEIPFEGFIETNQDGHSMLDIEHAIDLADYYMKHILPQENIEREIANLENQSNHATNKLHPKNV